MIQITSVGISQEAANIIGNTSLREVVLDVDAGTSTHFSKDVQKLSILNQIQTEGVLDTDLPFSKVNDAVFAEYLTGTAIDNSVVFYKIRLTVNGINTQFDRLLIRGRDESTQRWNVGFYRAEDHWIDAASNLKINALDYGTFELTQANLDANWELPVYDGDYKDPNTGQAPTYWPLIDYGGWVDQTIVPQNQTGRFKAVAVEDFRPLLSYSYILRAGFCAIGWTLEGVIFDADWFKRLWVYALKQNYYDASKNGGRVIGRSFDQVGGAGAYIGMTEISVGLTGWTLEFPGFPGFYLAGIKNNTGVRLVWRFTVIGTFTNNTASPFTALMALWEVDAAATLPTFTGEVLSPGQTEITIPANTSKQVVFTEVMALNPGQAAAVHIIQTPASGWYYEPGLQVRITPENQSLMRDDDVVVSECVSDENNLLEYLKDAMTMVNGRLETDFETKTVTIYPEKTSDVWGDTVPGFLLNEEPAIDIAPIIVPNSIRSTPVRPDLKRYSRFQFANTKDAYTASLNLVDPPHSRKLLNGPDLPNEIEEIKTGIFEATLEEQPTLIGSGSGGRQPLPYLPRLWDNTDGKRSFAIAPRILYAYGKVRQINPQPNSAVDTYTSFFFDRYPNNANTGLMSTFGYATQLPTWDIDPTPAVYGNVVFGVEETDLFVSFYLGFTQDARGGLLLDLLLWLDMNGYNEITFRNMYAFRYRGIPLRVAMQSIRDFDPTGGTPTPVTFFLAPNKTECCDLPCGCQFTTCDYYMDMGILMRQSTLDTLRVSSFVVDGIQYITAPIPFGDIEVIDIGSMPYVLNLVKTLNSIGVPYFTFGTSNREHYVKGKRFFTIKHPACIPFQITIQKNGTDDVYLYTELEQKTQWFTPGTWSVIGYGTETYTEPDNCQTTTEY